MIRGMVGTKDLQLSVEEIKNELPVMRAAIIRDIRADMKAEFNNAVQAYEVRMENKLETFFDRTLQQMNKISEPLNVVHAMEKRERDLELEKEIESIKLGFSEVYANVSKYEMIKGGSFTKNGITTYKLLNGLITRVAKLHGSNSINKIARREIYDTFTKSIGVSRVVKKPVAPYVSGTVFADLFEKELVGKYVEYIEENYVDRIKRNEAN